MKQKFLILPAFMMALSLTATPILAQTQTPSNNDTEENTEYEGINVDTPVSVPSDFALFMRAMRERIMMWLTLNPSGRSERAMKYAEEHMLIAEKMFEKNNDQMNLRARRMLEIAESMMDEVQNNEDKAMKNFDERAQRLLRNRMKQYDRHRMIMDRMEEKANDKTLDEIQKFREEMIARSRRLENAIQNENIPEEVRQKLQALKERIEAHATEIREHVQEVQDLRDRAERGEAAAEKKLEDLMERRREMIKGKVEEAQQMMERRREMMKEELEEENEAEEAKEAGEETE